MEEKVLLRGNGGHPKVLSPIRRLFDDRIQKAITRIEM
jgi:hypothetical protein